MQTFLYDLNIDNKRSRLLVLIFSPPQMIYPHLLNLKTVMQNFFCAFVVML